MIPDFLFFISLANTQLNMATKIFLNIMFFFAVPC